MKTFLLILTLFRGESVSIEHIELSSMIDCNKVGSAFVSKNKSLTRKAEYVCVEVSKNAS